MSPTFKPCEKHGKEARWPEYQCDDCKQEYWIEKEKKDKADRLERWIKDLNLPPRVFDASKTFPQGHPAHLLTEKWKEIASEYGAVILSGRMGTGKSAWACSRIVETRGGEPIFRSMIGMIQDIRSTWTNSSSTSEKMVMKEFFSCPLLVIDDMGVQGGTENERNIIYQILMERYNYFRPTIITTNLNHKTPEGKAEIIKCFGRQIFDRFEGGFYSCEDWPRVRGVEKVGYVEPVEYKVRTKLVM